MKLVTFESTTKAGQDLRLGAWAGEHVIDLNAAFVELLKERGDPHPARVADILLPPDMLSFLEREDAGLRVARETLKAAAAWTRSRKSELAGNRRIVLPMSSVTLKAPLLNPPSLRDFFAFEAHALQGAARRGEKLPEEWREIPAYYKGNHREIYGPGDVLPWPEYTRRWDFELEIACVVGKRGRNLTPKQAARHIAGYTIFNDASARDIQRKEMINRMGPAKSKDFANALGPCLVTPDSFDPRAARLTARVNGRIWSRGRGADCYWDFPTLLSHISQSETIHPGDILGSGTYFTGCGLDLDRWVKPGDRLEFEVSGLGTLKNIVGRPTSSRPLYYNARKKRVASWK